MLTLTQCPLRRRSRPIWSSARKRLSPIPIIQWLGRHSWNDQAAAPSVQLCWAVWYRGKASFLHDSAFQSLVWSSSRKLGDLKDLVAFPFQVPQVPFDATLVKNHQYRTDLCYPKTSICSYVVPAHSSREKEIKTSSDITSRCLGKHPDCTTRGAA